MFLQGQSPNGKELFCQESVCRFESGLARFLCIVKNKQTKKIIITKNLILFLTKGKVAIGKARYLLNIVLCTWMFESSLFRSLYL